MLDWAADHFRLTGFLRGDVPQDATWRSVTGEDAETSIVDRRLGTSEEQGDYRGFRLAAGTAPGRYDWRIGPQIPAGASPEFPSLPLGTGKEAIDAVARMVLSQPPVPVRIALGAILYARVESREDGYEKLARLLKSVKLDPAAEDFTFQINWPRQSTVFPDIKVNRLTTWSVEQRTPIFIGGPAGTHVGAGKAHYRCRVVLDLSTDAKRQESLPKDRVLELWSELGSMALEIAKEGEIR